jgi:four helix bundle protein
MALAKCVYRATATMPWPHRNELGGQMRRAGVSTPSNIAEGFRQGSARAYAHHVRVAGGSTAELETQAELATDMGLWVGDDGAEIRAMAERTGRMLTGLASALDANAGRTCPTCHARRR